MVKKSVKKTAKKAAKKKVAKRQNKTSTSVIEPPEPISFPDAMPDRHRLFVLEYLQDYNATSAYKKVYCIIDDSVAAANGCRLLRNAKVKQVVETETDRAVDAMRSRLRDLVIRSLDETMSARMSDYLDSSGAVDVSKLTSNGRAIVGFTQDVHETESGTRIRTTLTLESKAKAREQTMKMTGLLADIPAGTTAFVYDPATAKSAAEKRKRIENVRANK